MKNSTWSAVRSIPLKTKGNRGFFPSDKVESGVVEYESQLERDFFLLCKILLTKNVAYLLHFSAFTEKCLIFDSLQKKPLDPTLMEYSDTWIIKIALGCNLKTMKSFYNTNECLKSHINDVFITTKMKGKNEFF